MNILTYALSGLLNAPKNILYRTINKPLKPRMIWLNVTDKCNSKCLHCSIWKQKPTEDPLTPEEIYVMLLSPVFNKLQTIVNTGGECTLRSDLVEIIIAEHTALPKAKLIISTNGLLPERVVSAVKRLKDVGIKVSVGVSLDGVGSNHDLARGVHGNFDKVVQLLSRLEDVELNVPFVLSDLTVDSIGEVRECVKGFGKDIAFNVLQCNDAEYYHNEGQPNLQKDKMVKAVEGLVLSEAGGLLAKNTWLKWLRGKPIKFQCFALQTSCAVKCNGDIVPCLSMWESAVGNIRWNSVEEIWSGDSAREKRQLIKQCPGCLNWCSVGESYYAAFYPYLEYLKHPRAIIEAIR